MVTIQHKTSKRKLHKTRHEADIILNNKITGNDWKEIAETPEAAAPPEVKKVSIKEEAQEVHPKKPTKKNNAD